MVGAGDECAGNALELGAAGSSDPVRIGFGGVGYVEVDYMGDPTNVDSASGNVCSDEDIVAARAKAVHGVVALALGHVPLEADCAMAVPVQLFGESLGSMLRSRKHDCRAAIVAGQHTLEEFLLAVFSDEIQSMVNGFCGGRIRKFDYMRVDQEVIRETSNFTRHGSRKQEVLPFRGKRADDPLNVGEEAHIEHVISLIQYECLDLVQAQLPLAQQIEHTSRTADDDFRSPAEVPYLFVNRDPAVNDGHLHPGELGQSADFSRDLRRKLTRRRENESPRSTSASLEQSVEKRQRKSRRLPRARLGESQYVAPRKTGRNRFVLNRSWILEAGGFYAANKIMVKFEPVKSGRCSVLVFRQSESGVLP